MKLHCFLNRPDINAENKLTFKKAYVTVSKQRKEQQMIVRFFTLPIGERYCFETKLFTLLAAINYFLFDYSDQSPGEDCTHGRHLEIGHYNEIKNNL